MTKPFTFGKLDVEIVASMERIAGLPDSDTPFRILVMGDFSGRSGRGGAEPRSTAERYRLQRVDRDNIEELMVRLGVGIDLPLGVVGDSPATLWFEELDDFHPDQVYEHLSLFDEIRKTRKRLNDPATFSKAATDWGREGEATSDAGMDESLKDVLRQTSADLLDQIICDSGNARQPVSPPDRNVSAWDSFLKRLAQPHLVPDMDQAQSNVLAAIDNATGDLIRAILSYPGFQQLEAAWRGLHFLVSRTESDDELQLYLLDISWDELVADVGSCDDPRATNMFRLLVEETVETPGGEPWALLAGNYTFGATAESLEVLGRMAKIARAAGAPFVAAGDRGLAGAVRWADSEDSGRMREPECSEITRAWETLRALPEAAYAGLALPRFLLRLPYGNDTDPIERFEFEEMETSPGHEQYLWGNPAFACACLLAQTFSEYGWRMRPGAISDIEGLPLHVFKEQGTSKTKPCAEFLLTDSSFETIVEMGLMPLVTLKDRDVIRLVRFQSLANPPMPLAGRWVAASGE